MSLHYEWIMSLRLLPSAPASFVEELRWHLGLQMQDQPRERSLALSEPALTPSGDDSPPGGEAVSLREERPYLNRPPVLGLFVRLLVLDDVMYDLAQLVPPWLARWSMTQGWIGFAREEMSLVPWMVFYAQDGYAYAGQAGSTPEPLHQGGPRFRLKQTSDRDVR